MIRYISYQLMQQNTY